jgi:hypothetical protein
VAQISSDSDFAHGSEDLSYKRTKNYNQGYDQGFLLFWNDYPRKRDKRKAQIAWRKSVLRLAQTTGANRADAMAQILAGAIRYRDDPNRVEEFTKYAEGWLNGDGWEDEPLPVRSIGNGRAIASVPIVDELAWDECQQCGNSRRVSELLGGRCVTCRESVSA